MKKIHVLLGQIDDVIAREKSSENNEEVGFTPAMLTEMAYRSNRWKWIGFFPNALSKWKLVPKSFLTVMDFPSSLLLYLHPSPPRPFRTAKPAFCTVQCYYTIFAAPFSTGKKSAKRLLLQFIFPELYSILKKWLEKQPDFSEKRRVLYMKDFSALIGQMTVPEKLAQMTQLMGN